jgi:hypothetical protein
MKKIILSLAVCLSILPGYSCASKMPASYTPQTKKLYVLTDVVNGIGTLQLAAENAVPAGKLKVNSARIIVQFCVGANTAIGQSPNGWYNTVNIAYQYAKNQLTSDELNKFQVELAAFEIVLNSFAGSH